MALSREQQAVASQIIYQGRIQGLTPDLIIGGIDAAIPESGLENLNYGDANSLGAFQQQTQYYPQVDYTSVASEAKAFFQNLVGAPGATIPEKVANVQRPRADLRHIYADSYSQAQAVYDQIGNQPLDPTLLTMPTVVGKGEVAGTMPVYAGTVDPNSSSSSDTPITGVLKSLDAVLNIKGPGGVLGTFASLLDPVSDLRVIVSRSAVVVAGMVVGTMGLIMLTSSLGKPAKQVVNAVPKPIKEAAVAAVAA